MGVWDTAYWIRLSKVVQPLFREDLGGRNRAASLEIHHFGILCRFVLGHFCSLCQPVFGLRGKVTIVDLVNLFSFVSGDRCVKHWSLHWKLYKICPPIEPEMVISDCVQELPSPPLSPPIGPLQVPPGPPWREGRRSPLYPDYIFNAQHPTNFTHPCSIVYIHLRYMNAPLKCSWGKVYTHVTWVSGTAPVLYLF